MACYEYGAPFPKDVRFARFEETGGKSILPQKNDDKDDVAQTGPYSPEFDPGSLFDRTAWGHINNPDQTNEAGFNA